MSTASEFGKVGVLMGGWSVEREVSLNSGAMVCAGLRDAGIDAHALDVGRDITKILPTQNFDRVFNILHGKGGEDGVMQGLLEVLQIPYTGSGVTASAVAMNKLLTKQIWQSYDLPMASHCLIDGSRKLEDVVAELGLPLILKPVSEGSSVGVSKITSLDELEAAVAEHEHLGELMAEAFVDGEEYTIAILAGEALPVIRLETDNVFYDYEAKYLTDDTSYHIPCGLSAAEEKKIQTMALQAFEVLGASGWGRVDLMRDQAGNNYLIELNTQPGMTDHSLVPKAAAAISMSYPELVSNILATSIRQEC